MARRILLGKAGSDYGLFVSKENSDVLSATGDLSSGSLLQFDSRVGIGSLPLKFHGQGQLGRPSTISEGVTSDTFATITHGLGLQAFCSCSMVFLNGY